MREKQMKHKDFIIEREKKMKEEREKTKKVPRLPERTRREVIETLERDIALARYGYPVELAEALLWAYKERVLNNDEVVVEYPANRDIVVLKVFCEVCGHCELIPMTKNTLKDYVRSGTPYDRWKPNSDCYEISCGIESPLAGLQDMFATRMCAFCRSRSGMSDWSLHETSAHECLRAADVCVVRNRNFPVFGKGAFGGSDDPIGEIEIAAPFSEALEHLDGRLVIVEREMESVRFGGSSQYMTTASLVRCGYFDENLLGEPRGYKEVVIPSLCLEPFRYWQGGKYEVYDEGDALVVYDFVMMELSLDGADYKFKKKELMRAPVQEETEEGRRAVLKECKRFICKRFWKNDYIPCSGDEMWELTWRTLAMRKGAKVDEFSRVGNILPATGGYARHTLNGHLVASLDRRRRGLSSKVFSALKMKVDKEFSVSSVNREKSLFFSDGRLLYIPKKGDEIWLAKYLMCGLQQFGCIGHNVRMSLNGHEGEPLKCVVDRVYSHAFVAWDRRDCDVMSEFAKCRACKVSENENGLNDVGCCDLKYTDDSRAVRVNYPSITYHFERLDGKGEMVGDVQIAPLELIYHASRNVGCVGAFKVEENDAGGFDVVSKETGKVYTTFGEREYADDFVHEKESLVETAKFDLHTARSSMREGN